MNNKQPGRAIVAGLFLIGALLTLTAPAAAGEGDGQKEVIFYSDGRHSSVYLYEPPMSVRQYVEPIDELLDLGIDTITYAVGDCSVLLYDTKVGERWGHNLDLVNHIVWYRAGQNAHSFIQRGMDPLDVVTKHAQRRGFKFLPNILLNMLHTPPNKVTNSRVADFTTKHPEWQVGPEPDFPAAVHDLPHRLSYARPEIRADRLAVITELVSRYPTDGIEINFKDYAPFIARREVPEHTETMTGWLRQIRQACDLAAKEQGREKRLVIRIAGTLEGNRTLGMDLETWIREELVDSVIAMPVTHGYEAGTPELRKVVEAAKGTKVKVLAGINNSANPQDTREVFAAAAANAYAAGAEGVLFHTYYPDPERYPYDDSAMESMRFMGYPDVLAHRDKRFRIGSNPKADTPPKYGVPWQLPLELVPGEKGKEIHLDVADDLAAKAGEGELWRCELQVMVQHMMHTDKVKLWWNGKELPEGKWRKADWTYQMRPRPQRYRGYRLHVDLRGEDLPKMGRNTIRVDVLEKDSKLVFPIMISDVELVVEYLPGRNGLRPGEGGPGLKQ